jgi:hypothetical protein
MMMPRRQMRIAQEADEDNVDVVDEMYIPQAMVQGMLNTNKDKMRRRLMDARNGKMEGR